jgi:hypothetical protein
MRAKKSGLRNSIRLSVPFYKQRFDFTCGPAALMMAMKHFDRKLELSKELEMDIWREANMLESYGTSRFGLAFSALKRGFGATMYANIKGAGFVRKIESMIGSVDYRLLDLFLDERRRRSIGLGAKERKVDSISKDVLERALNSGRVPIVLSNTEFFSAEDVPHWIVVSGMDQNFLYVNNPLGRAGEQLAISSFERVVGYKGDECMVAISRG